MALTLGLGLAGCGVTEMHDKIAAEKFENFCSKDNDKEACFQELNKLRTILQYKGISPYTSGALSSYSDDAIALYQQGITLDIEYMPNGKQALIYSPRISPEICNCNCEE